MMHSSQTGWSRRNFIRGLSGTGAAVLLSPLLSWKPNETDPTIAAIVARTIGIDTHNHIDVPLNADAVPGPKADLAGELKRSGLSAICMTFAVDYQQLRNPGDAYDRFTNGLTAMDAMLTDNKMTHALNLADIKAAHIRKQPVVVQSVEGGHFLDGKLDRLPVAYKRGLRQLGLLHDNDASVPLGDVYTNPPRWGGLSAFGAEVIKQCNRLGILIDMAHASNETLNAALKLSTKPVLISHTGLDTQLGQNAFMAKMMRPRLISKEQAKLVAAAGGVIGVWTHLADTALEYAQNIRAMVDVTGIDHVCIGTDTKLTPAYRPPGDGGQQRPPGEADPIDKKAADSPEKGRPVAAGNGPNKGRPGERTNEAWEGQKDGFYYAVVEALLRAGFKEVEISKIGGGNFCRIFDAATAGK